MRPRRPIVCVGNRFAACDALGPRVHDLLAARVLPPGVELVDGGLGGLNLAPLADAAERVVFVDALEGFSPPGVAVSVEASELVADADLRFGHGDGLSYLVRALAVAPGPRGTEVLVAGAAGVPDEATVEAVAGLAVSLASGERAVGRQE